LISIKVKLNAQVVAGSGKRVDIGRASRDGGHHGDAITIRCLFSLDTGHGTFSFSAAKKLRHQMAVDWKNQCALTSTQMLLTF